MNQFVRFEQAPPRRADSPDQVYAREALQRLDDELRGARSMPWAPEIVERHGEGTVPYLCGLLEDEREAADWACSIEAEMARLATVAGQNPNS
jgi:hypothetical protein